MFSSPHRHGYFSYRPDQHREVLRPRGVSGWISAGAAGVPALQDEPGGSKFSSLNRRSGTLHPFMRSRTNDVIPKSVNPLSHRDDKKSGADGP